MVILVIEINNFCCNLRRVQLLPFYHFQIWRCLVTVDESTSAASLHVHEMTLGQLTWSRLLELVLGLVVLSSLLLEMDDGEEVVGV